MHNAIKTVYDSQRQCGWRRVGGLYLRSDSPGVPCGVLPLELKSCPTCEAMGLKCRVAPSRGFTWINPSKLWNWNEVQCQKTGRGVCSDCAMSLISKLSRAGLLFIGEKFYTPEEFRAESQRMGISRRLPHNHIPKGFNIGVDYILLGHRKAVLRLGTDGENRLMDYFPGIVEIFRPDRIEVVVSGEEADEEIEALVERGLTPVKVEHA